jgi:acetylglutamate kinase
MTDSVTVVKIGGSTLGRHDTSLDDIAALHAGGHRLVVVHGGGATISEWLEKHDVESRFVRGLRATDARTLEVVVAVLAGLVNKRLVVELQGRGARAFGLSGADGAVLRARRYDPELGFVGEIAAVDADALRAVVEGAVAVLAPIAVELALSGAEGLQPQLLNVNADTVAGEVAAALPAERLVFLTDVPGVMDAEGAVRPQLSAAEARDLLKSGAVTGGMIPKVEAALRAAAGGVPTAVVDGREAGALRALLAGEPGEAPAKLGGTRIG